VGGAAGTVVIAGQNGQHSSGDHCEIDVSHGPVTPADHTGARPCKS
jgi:hypothetical protein